MFFLSVQEFMHSHNAEAREDLNMELYQFGFTANN